MDVVYRGVHSWRCNLLWRVESRSLAPQRARAAGQEHGGCATPRRSAEASGRIATLGRRSQPSSVERKFTEAHQNVCGLQIEMTLGRSGAPQRVAFDQRRPQHGLLGELRDDLQGLTLRRTLLDVRQRSLLTDFLADFFP